MQKRKTEFTVPFFKKNTQYTVEIFSQLILPKNQLINTRTDKSAFHGNRNLQFFSLLSLTIPPRSGNNMQECFDY